MLTDDEARESVIIALDCDRDTAIDLATRLQGKARWVKVGMTLFYAEGPSIVREMRDRGFKVFLDLKLHDIPFQVRGAARSASLTGADLLSIHGMGSSEMVRQARAGVEDAAGERGGDRTRHRKHRPHERVGGEDGIDPRLRRRDEKRGSRPIAGAMLLQACGDR